MTQHPHTQYWFAVNFGFDHVPRWYKRSKALLVDLAVLWSQRQAMYYEGQPIDAFRALQRSISHRYGISYASINQFLGVAATDASDPFSVMRDYLDDAKPKLKRTSRG